jgi:hypothetical protein
MTNDHLAAVANQKNGEHALFELVRQGKISTEEAVSAFHGRRRHRTLAQKLAHWFSRAMFYLAGHPNP